jgi:hypothetical protein
VQYLLIRQNRVAAALVLLTALLEHHVRRKGEQHLLAQSPSSLSDPLADQSIR